MDSKEKKHIAFFIPSLHLGGGENALVELANAFADGGHATDMILPELKGPYGARISGAVNVIELKTQKMRYAIFALGRYMKKNKPDVLISTSEHAHIISLMAKVLYRPRTRIALRIGIPFSILFKKYDTVRDRITIPILARALYRFADEIIAVSFGIADDISKTLHISREKIKVIYTPKDIHSIREKAASPVTHKWFRDSAKPVVLGVGRLSEQKDFATLLKAFAGVIKKIPARLVLIGNDGGERNNLASLARGLGIEEDVYISGFADNPYSYMARADVFVLPSLWEGLPNALIEALACGIPIIATDCVGGGPREILAPGTDINKRIGDGIEYAEYGILIAPKDSESIAQAIEELLDNNKLKEKYIAEGARRAQDFSHDKIIKKYEDILLYGKNI